MVVIIAVGIVLSGIGCAVFFSSEIGMHKIEYTEKFFETEDKVDALDIRLEHQHKVVFERGDKCSVRYFDSDVSNFSVRVSDGKLVIEESRWNWKNWLRRLFYKFQQTDVVITVPDGVALDIDGCFNGASEIVLPSWEFGKLDFVISGASNVVAEGITSKRIDLDISGAANFRLSGKTDNLRVYASGAVKMNCDTLDCPQVYVYTSGTGEIILSGRGDALTVNASGLSNIWAKDFVTDTVHIEASGDVEAEFNVATLLDVKASGVANISYWGNARVEKNVSGSANIVKRG